MKSIDTEHALGLHDLMFGGGGKEDSQVYESVAISIETEKPMTIAELERAIVKAASSKELSALAVLIPSREMAGAEVCKRLWRRHWSRTVELDARKHGLKIKGVTGEGQ